MHTHFILPTPLHHWPWGSYSRPVGSFFSLGRQQLALALANCGFIQAPATLRARLGSFPLRVDYPNSQGTHTDVLRINLHGRCKK